MNVNFFVTCIGDALKSRMARDSVLLLEKLGCRVNFPEKQGCCGQPAINSGYIKFGSQLAISEKFGLNRNTLRKKINDYKDKLKID